MGPPLPTTGARQLGVGAALLHLAAAPAACPPRPARG